MNAITTIERPALVPITHETEIHGSQGEIVTKRIPKNPLVLSDSAGDRYVSLPHAVSGGIVHLQLYGLLGPDLQRARGRKVSAVIHGIVTCTYADGKRSTHVGLVYADRCMPTHHLVVYGKTSHLKKSEQTELAYLVPGTGGAIEIQKRI